jgi:hypothetical protein
MTELSAERTNLTDLFRKQAVYEIPEYQRKYSWEEKHFRDLWNDLEQGIAYKRVHHMDEITVVPFREHDPTTFQVIDGQQRLTTLALLICAIRDVYDERGGPGKYVEQLHEFLESSDRDANPIRRLQLLEEPGDDAEYQQIYQTGSSDGVDGQIGEGYRFFKKKLSVTGADRLDEIRTYVIDSLSFILTTVEDLDQAFVMFETTNSRGLDLTPLQMAKSILMRIAHRRGKSDISDVQRVWMDILDNANSADGGKPKRPIKDILVVTDRFETPLELSNRGFVQHIRTVFQDHTSEPVVDLLRWLAQELDDYETIKKGRVSAFQKDKNAHINSLIQQFNVKNSHSGLNLYWLFRNKTDPGEIIEALDWFSKLSLRLFLAGKTAYKKRDAMTGTYKQLKDGVEPASAVRNQIRRWTPNDRSLELELQEREFARNEATRFILYRVEAEHFGGAAVRGSVYPSAGEDIEVEHVAPMQAFSAKKYSPWRPVLNNDKDRFETHRKKLGNLTLLRSKQNQEAGTQPFGKKRQNYRNSDFGMSQDISREFSGWSFEQIDARTKEIANKAVQTFSADGYNANPLSRAESDGGSRIQDYVGGSDD